MSAHNFENRRRPTLPVAILLVMAVITTMATSESEHPTYLMGWSSDFGSQAKVEVKIAKRVLNYLHDEAPNSPWYVDVYLNEIDPVQGQTARWWLLDGQGQAATTDPMEFVVGSGVAPALQIFSHLSYYGALPSGLGHAVARLGRLCHRQSAAEDCLPCDLKYGCTFNMVLDACGLGSVAEAVFVVRQGDNGFITCRNEATGPVSCGDNDERACEPLATLGETNVTPYTPSEDTPACRIVESPAPVDGGVTMDADESVEDATLAADGASDAAVDLGIESEADAVMGFESDAEIEPEGDAAVPQDAD